MLIFDVSQKEKEKKKVPVNNAKFSDLFLNVNQTRASMIIDVICN